MKQILLVGLGSCVGGILRYLTSQFVQIRIGGSFPYGTLVVNVAGCFIIGLLYALSVKSTLSEEGRLLLATGLCGGFTTFSAFSNETLIMVRHGQIATALLYVGISVLAGLLATYIGFSIAK